MSIKSGSAAPGGTEGGGMPHGGQRCGRRYDCRKAGHESLPAYGLSHQQSRRGHIRLSERGLRCAESLCAGPAAGIKAAGIKICRYKGGRY